MKLSYNASLKAFNTFGIDVSARAVSFLKSENEFQTIRRYNDQFFILGGGSNMLLKNDLDAFVIKNEIKGRDVIEESDKHVIVKFGGGEDWHQSVLWSIQNGFGGIENLSLIPGTVGASPIQNIGAYGVELKDVFVSAEAIELNTGKHLIFNKEDCDFGYRDSIFKRELKSKVLITRVSLKLSTKAHRLSLNYGAIKDKISHIPSDKLDIADVSKAVIEIRQSKLPDPKELGNSGSFFKNPVVSSAKHQQLSEEFKNLVSYPLPSGEFKIPAGWLIDQCGWKGKRVGNTGCYKDQALVLVNYGNASGAEIWSFAQTLIASVNDKFGIELDAEVNVI